MTWEELTAAFHDSPVLAITACVIAVVVLFGVLYFVKEVIRHLVKIGIVVLVIGLCCYVVYDWDKVSAGTVAFFRDLSSRW